MVFAPTPKHYQVVSTPLDRKPQGNHSESGLPSKIKVTFGASDNYVTNGVSADLKEGRISTLVSVIPEYNDAGVVAQYDKDNEKIKCFVTGASNGAVLAELADASTAVNSKIFEFLVIGY